MFYSEFSESQILRIDLHGFKRQDAKNFLTQTVLMAPPGIREIVVIHGYHGGVVLQQMVRNDFNCDRVSRKIIGMNPGITSLILVGGC